MEHRSIEPHNFLCVFCAMYCGLEVPADDIIWNEFDNIAYPVCDAHTSEAVNENFYTIFSLN